MGFVNWLIVTSFLWQTFPSFPWRPTRRFVPDVRVFFVRRACSLDNRNEFDGVTIVNLVVPSRARVSIFYRWPCHFGISCRITVYRRVLLVTRISVCRRPIVRWPTKRRDFYFRVYPAFFANARINTCIPIFVTRPLKRRVIRLAKGYARNWEANHVEKLIVVNVVVNMRLAGSRRVGGLYVRLFFHANDAACRFPIFLTCDKRFRVRFGVQVKWVSDRVRRAICLRHALITQKVCCRVAWEDEVGHMCHLWVGVHLVEIA